MAERPVVADIAPSRQEVARQPDARTRREEKRLDLAWHQAHLDSLRQDIQERKRYARWVFVLLCAWLLLLFVTLAAQGFRWGGFELTERVLLALIGGTTINVIGIFIVVMNYLFPKSPSDSSPAGKSRRVSTP